MEKLPREKLILNGVESLTDDELLSIILGCGSKNENVFNMSKRIIKDYGFNKLYKMDYNSLSKISGIKIAKATKLMVIFEIAKRIVKYENEMECIKTSKDLYNYVYHEYILLKKEMLTVIYVNSKLQILNKEKISQNEYSQINIPIKQIVKNAIDYDAYGIFLVHNHPSGNEMPSQADNKSTKNLTLTLKGVGIILLDHIIIGEKDYFSYSDTNTRW